MFDMLNNAGAPPGNLRWTSKRIIVSLANHAKSDSIYFFFFVIYFAMQNLTINTSIIGSAHSIY